MVQSLNGSHQSLNLHPCVIPSPWVWVGLYDLFLTNRMWLRWEFPGGPVVKTLPSNAGGEGSIPGRGAKIPRASQPKNQNLKQKQYCNKFNKDFKNGPYKKKNLKERKTKRMWYAGGISLPRLGYKKSVTSILGVFSLSLSSSL